MAAAESAAAAKVRVEEERLRFEQERYYDEQRRLDEERWRREEERERREQEERERRDACRECEGGTGSHVCWSCEQREQERLERLKPRCPNCDEGTRRVEGPDYAGFYYCTYWNLEDVSLGRVDQPCGRIY